MSENNSLSYERDIAPLSQEHFPSLMGYDAYERHLAFREDKLIPMQIQTQKLRDDQSKRDIAALNYQTAQLRLQGHKDEIENKQRYQGMATEINGLVDGILSDPEKTLEQRQDEISALHRKNIVAATNSPVIENIFNSVNTELTNRRTRNIKKNNDQNALRGMVANNYFQTLGADADDEIYLGLRNGTVSVDDGQALIKDHKDKIQSALAAKGAQDNLGKWFEDNLNFARGIAFDDGSKSGDTYIGGGEEEDDKPPPVPAFSKNSDKLRLLNIVKRLEGVEEDYVHLSPVQLQQKVISLIQTEADKKSALYRPPPEIQILTGTENL